MAYCCRHTTRILQDKKSYYLFFSRRFWGQGHKIAKKRYTSIVARVTLQFSKLGFGHAMKRNERAGGSGCTFNMKSTIRGSNPPDVGVSQLALTVLTVIARRLSCTSRVCLSVNLRSSLLAVKQCSHGSRQSETAWPAATSSRWTGRGVSRRPTRSARQILSSR